MADTPSARALTTNRLQQVIPQITHGFVVGQVLRYDGTVWVLAQADTLVHSQSIGIVSLVISPDIFVLCQTGFISNIVQTLVAADLYYLDPTTPGALTSTAPSGGNIVKPLLIADTTHSGYFQNSYVTSGSSSFTWSLINADQTLGVNQGYFVHGGVRLNLPLPPAAVIGDTIKIWDIRGNGFTVTQAMGQSVLMGSQTSMVGAGGSIASTQLGNELTIICYLENTGFAGLPGLASFNVT